MTPSTVARKPEDGARRGDVATFVRAIVAIAPRRAMHVFGLMLARSVTSGFGLLMLIPLLAVVGLDVGDGSVGRVAGIVANAFDRAGIRPTLAAVLGVYVAVMTANAFLARWQTVTSTELEQDVVSVMRTRLYDAVTRAAWSSFVRQRASNLTHVLTTEVERMGAAVSAFLGLGVKIVLGAVYLGFALALAPAMTGVAALAGVGLALALGRTTRAGHRKGAAVSSAYADMYAAIGEHLAGMKVSKSLGVEDEQRAHFRLRAATAATSRVDLERNAASLALGFEVGSVLVLASLVWLALAALAMPVASVLLVLYLFARLLPFVTGVQKGYQRFLTLLPAFERTMAAVDANLAAAEAGQQLSVPFELDRGVVLESVAYAYDDGSDVLRGVDMTLRAGETTALVGASGSGKSTIADLVIGLALPHSGCVRIDGEMLTPDRLVAWRRQVGYVPQDVFLFHDTIRANLELVAPDARDDDLWHALRDASADAFVAALPEGLDTVVGDRGVRLSGGERQRLALARALLRKPSLLVLDEATSALDVENERRIQAAIDRLRGKITILVIAHRLSTVRATDAIHVLDEGRIVESGTWRDLVAIPHGRFRRLCRTQGLLEREAAPTT